MNKCIYMYIYTVKKTGGGGILPNISIGHRPEPQVLYIYICVINIYVYEDILICM
jgi:hypothetical protein